MGWLYLIEILHQTTTVIEIDPLLRSCILSKFYIKPQLCRKRPNFCCVVSYRNSTSNHNCYFVSAVKQRVVSYRNSTSNHNFARGTACQHRVVSYRNSTSNHNFKIWNWACRPVVSYRNSTSNHNTPPGTRAGGRLYLIEILHQTTTKKHNDSALVALYLIEILHQTTTLRFHFV